MAHGNELSGKGVAILAVFVLLLFMCSGFMTFSTTAPSTVTINKTERVTTGDSSKYLVYTDTEVFENTDSLWYTKFNSSDIHGRLKAGHTYVVKVSGWRIPVLSWYRNIVEIVEEQERK